MITSQKYILYIFDSTTPLSKVTQIYAFEAVINSSPNIAKLK